MSTIAIKVLLSVFGMAAIVGAGYYMVSVIQNEAVLEAALESTTVALSNYATKAEEEIYAYSEATRILGERDQKARDERDDKFSSIEDRDLTKMSKRHPDQLAHILTGRTNRMLQNISKASRSTRVSRPSTTQ